MKVIITNHTKVLEAIAKPMSIEEFADLHGLEMHVMERDPKAHPGHDHWYACFKNPSVEIKHGGCLRSTFGNGHTPNKAIRDYAEEISGTTLVIDAMGPNRREIKVPTLKV
jgi:hypothetical protein